MATANDIIKRSLRLLNVKAFGENLNGAEAADGLAILNNYIDSLGNEPTMQFGMTQITHTLVASDGDYSIGATGDITTTWPMRIATAFIRDSDGNDYSMEIINSEQYSKIWLKTIETTYPNYLYYNRQFPNGTIFLWPEPSSALTLVLNVWPQIGTFATGATAVSLPPGYQRMLEYALAIELAPEFKLSNVGFLQQQLNEAKLWIKISNGTETPVLRSAALPILGRGGFSVSTGDYI